MLDYRLYLVTDDPSRYAGDWLDNVVASVEGGVTCVQYRDTESAPAERFARLRRLQDALRGRAPLIVNNDAELAAAVKAEGVHVGQHDLPPAKVRAIVGPACEIGLSITHISQLAQLTDNPYVDCLGIGPVFDARKTKADAADALGPAGLAEIVAALPPSHHPPTPNSQLPTPNPQPPPPSHHLPAVAIGGITLANAPQVLATGVSGLAVVSAFSKLSDPYAVARAFRKAMAEGEGEDERRKTRGRGRETRGERQE